MIDNNDEVENYINSLVYLCNKLCINYQSIINNTNINNTILDNCDILLEEPILPNNNLTYIILYTSLISIIMNFFTCMFKCYHKYISV
jgi:hypothetical protein